LKKPAGSVRFRFYNWKTEPNRTETDKKQSQNRKKPSQNRKTRAKPVWTGFCLKNRTEPKPVGLTRFRFGFGFFFKKKKNSVWLFFLIKTELNRKWSPLILIVQASLYQKHYKTPNKNIFCKITYKCIAKIFFSTNVNFNQ